MPGGSGVRVVRAQLVGPHPEPGRAHAPGAARRRASPSHADGARTSRLRRRRRGDTAAVAGRVADRPIPAPARDHRGHAVDRFADDALDPESIRAALARLHRAFRGSPQFVHDGLSEHAARPVIVKVETVNPIGAFKGRGTWLAVAGLAGEGVIGPGRPVVVASTGNFGQGVAFAARAQGVPAVVFADEHANPLKLSRMRAFGATVDPRGPRLRRGAGRRRVVRPASDAFLLIDGQEPSSPPARARWRRAHRRAAERGDLPRSPRRGSPVGNGALIIGVGAWLRARGARLPGHRRPVRRGTRR